MKVSKVIIALFCCCILIASCDFVDTLMSEEYTSVQESPSSEEQTNENKNDSALVEVQLLKKDFADVQNEVNNLSIELTPLRSSISNMKLMVLVSSVFSIIAIVIMTILLLNNNKRKRSLRRRKEEIEKLYQCVNALDNKLASLSKTKVSSQSAINQLSSFDISDLKRRISAIETKFDAILDKKNIQEKIINPDKYPPTPNPQVETREGYLGAIVKSGKGYFRNILSSKDSEARFYAKITDNNMLFEPLSLQIATSYDYMDLAIEFIGIARTEARSMNIRKSGVAKLEDGKWIIHDKAVIELCK